MAIKKARAIGINGKIFHTACWHSTIYVKLNEPENKININTIEEKTNSYESNWAVALIAPRKLYFEFADHPLIKIPYPPNEETAKAKNTPNSKSNIAKPSPKGIIAHPNNANIKVIQGPNTNNILLDCLGLIISFTNNFKASATNLILKSLIIYLYLSFL
jgi:hypothetical protein